MAENKRSFVLYADQYELFKKLPNDQAGELIKHIFAYVNDENPETDNLLIQIAFEPIKAQLKRDLKRWEEKIEARSRAGKASAEAKKANKEQQTSTNSTHVDFVQQTSTKSTDNVNDNVNVNVNVNDNVNLNINHKDIEREENTGDESPTLSHKKTIEERKMLFKESLRPFLGKYSNEMLKEFFEYWTETNEQGTKFRKEKEKFFDLSRRLVTWSNREKNKTSIQKQNEPYDIKKEILARNTPNAIINR